MKRATVVRMLLATLAAAAAAGPAAAPASDQEQPAWAATWGAPPMAAGSALRQPRALENVTVRQVLRVSAGGRRVRVRLSNAFGSQPLRIAAAHVALHGDGPSLVP